jgi:hypothetical protein
MARRWIIPRAAWTTSPRGGERQDPTAPILFVHYSTQTGRLLTTWAKQREAIRAIRNYHVEANGWADIGYSYLVTQPAGFNRKARTWVGRGRKRVPASQYGHNTGNLSVCVLTDGKEPIRAETVEAIARLARRVGARDVQGHRDVNATACPGDRLYTQLPRIRKLAGL